jgi:hypothetical protein
MQTDRQTNIYFELYRVDIIRHVSVVISVDTDVKATDRREDTTYRVQLNLEIL